MAAERTESPGERGYTRISIGTRTSVETVLSGAMDMLTDRRERERFALALVEALLRWRFPAMLPPKPRVPRAYRADAKSNTLTTPNAVFVVALGLPNERRLAYITRVLRSSGSEIWVLTRPDAVVAWRTELTGPHRARVQRLAVSSVEHFLGQSISMAAQFEVRGEIDQLRGTVNEYSKIRAKRPAIPLVELTVGTERRHERQGRRLRDGERGYRGGRGAP